MNKKNTKRRINDLNHTISQININRSMSGGAGMMKTASAEGADFDTIKAMYQGVHKIAVAGIVRAMEEIMVLNGSDPQDIGKANISKTLMQMQYKLKALYDVIKHDPKARAQLSQAVSALTKIGNLLADEIGPALSATGTKTLSISFDTAVKVIALMGKFAKNSVAAIPFVGSGFLMVETVISIAATAVQSMGSLTKIGSSFAGTGAKLASSANEINATWNQFNDQYKAFLKVLMVKSEERGQAVTDFTDTLADAITKNRVNAEGGIDNKGPNDEPMAPPVAVPVAQAKPAPVANATPVPSAPPKKGGDYDRYIQQGGKNIIPKAKSAVKSAASKTKSAVKSAASKTKSAVKTGTQSVVSGVAAVTKKPRAMASAATTGNVSTFGMDERLTELNFFPSGHGYSPIPQLKPDEKFFGHTSKVNLQGMWKKKREAIIKALKNPSLTTQEIQVMIHKNEPPHFDDLQKARFIKHCEPPDYKPKTNMLGVENQGMVKGLKNRLKDLKKLGKTLKQSTVGKVKSRLKSRSLKNKKKKAENNSKKIDEEIVQLHADYNKAIILNSDDVDVKKERFVKAAEKLESSDAEIVDAEKELEKHQQETGLNDDEKDVLKAEKKAEKAKEDVAKRKEKSLKSK